MFTFTSEISKINSERHISKSETLSNTLNITPSSDKQIRQLLSIINFFNLRPFLCFIFFLHLSKKFQDCNIKKGLFRHFFFKVHSLENFSLFI